MTWVYRTNGQVVGFVQGRTIHTLNGRAIGQLQGTRVYTVRGAYVGELYDDQVVNMHRAHANTFGSAAGNVVGRVSPGNRGGRGCPYRDVFDALL
jgi:hypothetical protein